MSFGKLGKSWGSFGSASNGASGPANAAQTNAFLARTSGLSSTEIAAYIALINGLVSDGTFSLLKALYIFATNTTTTANLNLISTSFGITTTAAPTFAADVGYTGNGTSQFLNTNLAPSAAFVQNTASFGVYVTGGRTTQTNIVAIGSAVSGSTNAYIKPLVTSSAHASIELNGNSFPGVTTPGNTANGFMSVVRTVSTGVSVYKNASSTAVGSPADTSTAVSTNAFYIFAVNTAGTASLFSTDTISSAYIGNTSITGAQHLLLSNRINAYMTALGINVY